MTLYPHYSKTAACVGIYSEVGIKTTVSDTAETKIIAKNGDEFTGLYDVIPATIERKDEHVPMRKSSQKDEEPEYAIPEELMKRKGPVNVDSQAYAVPDAPNHTLLASPVNHRSTESVEIHSKEREEREYALPWTKSHVKESSECVSVYSQVCVRETPAVPTKSSELEQYLSTESVFNVGIHSEPINPLDFTRDRKEGDKNDPQYLAPVYTSSAMFPEGGQDPTEVTSTNITEKMKLGTGQFGDVVLADTNGLSLKRMKLSKTDNNQNISIIVAVKKLKPNPSSSEKETFNKEVNLTAHLKHPNTLCFLGVCYQDPAFIMMEYTQEGDLNQFLQLHSEIVTSAFSSDDQITASELLYMASQIASGMQYLAKLSFIHRDLATRSCYVGRNSSIKVGDLGVNTTLHQSNYYRIRGNRLLPIRWMATECFSGKFSEKSDVWAFGVTMWELFTLGKEAPYPHLSDEEVIHNALKREHRQFPSQPTACPDHVYEIMEQCWTVDMTQRTTFKKLHTMLQTY